MRPVGKLQQLFLVSLTILQGHQVGIRPNQASIVLQCAAAIQSFHKHDHQIYRCLSGSVRQRMGSANLHRSVRFFNPHTVPVDFFYQRLVNIHQQHVVTEGQISPEQRSHGTSAQNCDSHFVFSFSYSLSQQIQTNFHNYFPIFHRLSIHTDTGPMQIIREEHRIASRAGI